MAELARTEPACRRLFQEVDLVPLPHHRPVRLGLAHWRTRRGRSLAPAAVMLLCGQFPEVVERSFIAEPAGPGRDFALTAIGGAAQRSLGAGGDSARLCGVPARRLAVRLRRLLEMAGARGEPIDVHFAEHERSYEMLAAPVLTDGGLPGFFCTIAAAERPSYASAR